MQMPKGSSDASNIRRISNIIELANIDKINYGDNSRLGL